MASIKPEKGLRPMNVKRIIRRVTDNDYLFTIFTKILAVLIGLVASFYSNRFLGPQLKGELGRISSLLSISRTRIISGRASRMCSTSSCASFCCNSSPIR